MNYHDYRLRGYSVSDFGSTLTLDLLYEYASQPRRESVVCFTGVVLYHFIHTAGAIITDISELPAAALLNNVATDLANWAKQYGLAGWKDTIENYQTYIAAQGLRAWTIDSAIGFSGYVIGKDVV